MHERQTPEAKPLKTEVAQAATFAVILVDAR
jgi:hypothetical protein